MALIGANIPIEPSAAAVYQGQRTQSIVAGRSHVEISPKYGGVFTAGNICRLEIPSQNWLDPDLFSLSFQAQIFAGPNNSHLNSDAALANPGSTIPPWGATGAGIIATSHEPDNYMNSTYCRFENCIQSIFNRIRILQGSTVIEDIQDYGQLYKILTLSTTPATYRATGATMLEGQVAVLEPNALNLLKKWQCHSEVSGAASVGSSTGAHYYNVRLLSGLLRCGKYIPLKYMGQLTIELYFESNAECLVSSVGGQTITGVAGNDNVVSTATLTSRIPLDASAITYPNAAYAISELKAHCHFVTPIEEYDRNALRMIEEQGLELYFDTYSTHNRQISSTGRTVLSFQERSVSVKGGFGVMRNSADIGDIRSDMTFPANNCEEYQWKMGSTFVPAQPVKCLGGAGRAYAELQAAFGAFGDVLASGSITERNFLPVIPTCAFESNPMRNATVGSLQGNGRTFDNYYELLAECSLPNYFIIPLNLEKSDGQLSGFNTSATNVDIELQLLLLDHSKLDTTAFGSYCNTYPSEGTWLQNHTRVIDAAMGTGAIAGVHTFQPSKFRWLESFGAIGNSGTSNIDNTTMFNLPDIAQFNGLDRTIRREYQDKTTGITKGKYPSGYQAWLSDKRIGQGATSAYCLATKNPSSYARFTFYAHVDAVLRLARVGQLEVYR